MSHFHLLGGFSFALFSPIEYLIYYDIAEGLRMNPHVRLIVNSYEHPSALKGDAVLHICQICPVTVITSSHLCNFERSPIEELGDRLSI